MKATPNDPAALLLQSPGEAVRRIARAFLDEAAAAAVRLDDPDDAESLHDFRVAIRRTRATFRAWPGALAPEIERSHARALVDVQRATGNGRDAEVMLAWVESQAEHLRPADEAGSKWLTKRLAKRKAQAYERARKDVRAAFAAVGETLHARLSVLTRTVSLDGPPDTRDYAGALADAIEAALGVVSKRLRPAATDDTPERLHKARIDTKRLRYLIEPSAGAMPEAAALVKRCKKLQDVLGLFQDASVLEEELRLCRSELKGKKRYAKIKPGLKRIDRLNDQRAEALFAEVRTKWLAGGELDRLAEAVAAFAGLLRAEPEPEAAEPEPAAEPAPAPEGLPVEIERKYLLNRLPPKAKRYGKRKQLAQGYLPGETLIERIRRTETADGVKFVRTVKAGKGLSRIELEEPCDERVYAALWPLTEGCRVEKIRYVLADGDLVWEIDAFTDRELFLAEVELPTEDTEVKFPRWLGRYVEREVTEDGSFTNRRLAN